VWATPPLVHANIYKLHAYKKDNNNGIIAVANIPQQPPRAPLVINDTDDNDLGSDEDADDTESDNDKSDNEDDVESNNNKPLTLRLHAWPWGNLTLRQPLTSMAMNQAKIKECKDHSAEERASLRSTSITVY
jgi:hypothetical protein